MTFISRDIKQQQIKSVLFICLFPWFMDIILNSHCMCFYHFLLIYNLVFERMSAVEKLVISIFLIILSNYYITWNVITLTRSINSIITMTGSLSEEQEYFKRCYLEFKTYICKSSHNGNRSAYRCFVVDFSMWNCDRECAADRFICALYIFQLKCPRVHK